MLDDAEVMINEVVTLIGAFKAAGMTDAQVERRIHELPLDLDERDLSRALDTFAREAGRIRVLQQPAAVIDPEVLSSSWYLGPRPDDRFWWPLERQLGEFLSDGAVEAIDRASTKVVSLLGPPGADEIRTRGLVLGHVQSGKTTNFAAVIAKAADAGYKLAIVLSGMHNTLRAQTQARLEAYLREPNPQDWYVLSSAEQDFINPGEHNATAILSMNDKSILVVIKKNATRLRAFLRWLQSADPQLVRKTPFLIIDDEADQASIDTSPVDDAEKRSTINELVLSLLNHEKVAYVGYTATPFANLLIDPSIPSGLYPSDFIVDLPKPDGYFGPELVFGRERLTTDPEDFEGDGLDVIRLVPEEDAEDLRPPHNRELREGFMPGIPSSMSRAIRYFLIATAARRVRSGGLAHSTMLVHTTLYSDVQHRQAGPIRAEVASVRQGLAEGDPSLIHELRDLWERESAKLPSLEVGLVAVPFDEVLRELPGVVSSVVVKVDNYISDDRLDYSGEPKTVIVVGGNTLSRGLTLEGLIVSYFIRTATAYDTLLQMGRWFGFRIGYEDLPRVWMTEELRDQFFALATVEREIRGDIARYEVEGITPTEFAVRIRTHPQLAVTSRMKMQSAVRAEVSYTGRRLQTILFEQRNRDWLLGNQAATRHLLQDGDFQPRRGGTWVASDVPVSSVLTFLCNYQFSDGAVDLQSDPLTAYIRAQNVKGELLRWNVAVMGQTQDREGTIDLGIGGPVNRIRRSSVNEDGRANIKTLMSRPDTVVDLEVDRATQDAPWTQQVKVRPDGVGLLLIYPIAATSQPSMRPGIPKRYPLRAVEDVIGVGFAFPQAAHGTTPQTYVAAPIDYAYIEEQSPDIELDGLINGG